jgi:Xaa-Pro aminopeptidase
MKYSAEKLKNFQNCLKKNKISAFAVSDLNSLRYLSDFPFKSEGDAFMLVTPSKAYCFTKPMYLIDMEGKVPYLTLIDSLDPADVVKKAVEIKSKNSAFDPALVMYIPGAVFKKAGFKEMPGALLKMRETKTAGEIKNIKKACQISAKAYDIFRRKLKTGMSEIEAASMLERIMSDLGGEGLAFTTIMAFGENGANPHHCNSERKLKKEDAVLMDYGCKIGGYCSDITRTFWHGKKPSAEFTKVFNIVKKAHDLGVKTAKAGMKAKDLDAVCRNYMDKQGGFAKYFIHSTGHGLGLYIHESPRVSVVSEDILQVDNVFTIEPGLYFKGKVGVRYESTVHLTKSGAKILTKN